MKQLTPPALPGLPVLGHLLAFRKDRDRLFRQGYDTLGPVFSIRLASKRIAVLVGLEYNRLFFEASDTQLSIRQAYQYLVPMFGEPVGMMAEPADAQEHRRIFADLFQSARMTGYVHVMAQEVQAWLDTLGARGTCELVATFERLTQYITAHAFLGAVFRHHMEDQFWRLFRDLVAGLDPVLPPYLPLPRFLRRDRAKRAMHALLRPLIAERRAHPGAHNDFLQALVEATYTDGRPLQETVIISMIVALIFAGYETTSGQASWALIHLLQHPDYLQHVLAEQAHVLPPDQPFTLDTVRQFHHLRWALKETERLCPAARMLLRYTSEAYEVGGYHVPAGWLTLVAPQLVHQMPEIFREPVQYDPWRFAPGREEDRQHRFALMGFGGGLHKCLGMHFAINAMTVILSLLLQQYHVELLTPHPQPQREMMRANRPSPCWIRYQRRGNGGAR